MGKGSNGSQQISNSDNYYNQEAQNSNTLMQQFMQTYYPEIQQLLPQLQSTVSGGPSPLMTAAQAPVNANTSHVLNTMQNNIGGTTNPDALYSDIALQGNQSAALAGDSMLNSSLSALQNIIGMGYGGVNTAQGGLQGAAGGEANLGLNLQQQSNQWWQSLLGAAGEAYGMSTGNPGSYAQAANSVFGGGGGGGNAPFSSPGVMGNGMNWFGLGSPGSVTPSGTLSTPSSPIGSGAGSGSYVPPANGNLSGG